MLVPVNVRTLRCTHFRHGSKVSALIGTVCVFVSNGNNTPGQCLQHEEQTMKDTSPLLESSPAGTLPPLQFGLFISIVTQKGAAQVAPSSAPPDNVRVGVCASLQQTM